MPTPPLEGLVETPALTRKRRQARWAGRVVLFFSCVLLFDGLFGDRGLTSTLKARQDLHTAAESLERLKHENVALRDEARRLQEDPATVEALARRELGLIRPGEILVVVKDLK
jgi:cell division protein FtsB